MVLGAFFAFFAFFALDAAPDALREELTCSCARRGGPRCQRTVVLRGVLARPTDLAAARAGRRETAAEPDICEPRRATSRRQGQRERMAPV